MRASLARYEIGNFFNVELYKRRWFYRWYRFLWRIAPYVRLPFPIHVDLETNSSCNLRCPICHQSDNPRPYIYRHQEPKEIRRLLKEARRLGSMSVKFNWRGEPLIYPYIWSVLEFARRIGYVDIGMNTNLNPIAPLTVKQVQILASLPTLKVSCDSITNYARARKGGNLQVVLENAARIIFSRSVIEFNRHESEFTEPVSKYKEMLAWKLFWEHGVDKGLLRRIKIHNNVAQVRNNNIGIFQSKRSGERQYCKMPDRRLLVSATSKAVYPCCVPYKDPEDLRVGDPGESLKSVWSGERINRIRKMLKSGSVWPSEACANCAASDAWKRK